MPKTALALYPTSVDARHVLDELKKAGYEDSQIRLLSGQDGAKSGFLANLTLAPRAVAAYREGIRRGGTLLLTTADAQTIDQAVTIMAGHNSINIHERSREWETEGWHPDEESHPHTQRSNSGRTQETTVNGGSDEMIGEHAEPQPGTKVPNP